MWSTIVWHFTAKIDLKTICRASIDPSAVLRAAREVSQLLMYDATRKGLPMPIGRLGPRTIEVLGNRAGVIPEIIRIMRCGPIEVFFTADEPGAVVNILMIRPR